MEASDRFLGSFGLDGQRVEGRDLRELLPGLSDRGRQALERGLAGVGDGSDDDLYRHPDGRIEHLRWEVSPWYEGPDRIGGVTVLAEVPSRGRGSEEVLRENAERFQILFEEAPDALYMHDMFGVFLDGNRSAEELIGYRRDELVGRSFLALDILPPSQLIKATGLLARSIVGLPTGPDELVLHHRDGSAVPVEVCTYPSHLGGRRVVLGVARDIRGRKRAEAQTRLLGTAIEAAANALLLASPDGTIEWVNAAFAALTGFAAEEAVGAPTTLLGAAPETPDGTAVPWARLLAGEAWRGRLVLAGKDGRRLVVDQAVTPSHDEEGTLAHLVFSLVDATEKLEAERRLELLAHYDPLTELPNRAAFLSRLERELKRARQGGRGVALLLLDLDHFKDVNDTYGHPTGDALLVAVARRLGECLRELDTLGRLSGDEFAILQTDVDEPEAAARLAERLIGAMAGPFDLGGPSIHATVSIGIAVSTEVEKSCDPRQLIRRADTALYRAKAAGRHTFRLHAEEMDREVERRMTLGQDLHSALGRGELFLEYQPQIDVGSGEIVGAEVLVRWQHPTFGRISPGEFIPIAERSGLILPIGTWIIEAACRQWCAWRDEGLAPPPLSVNVSAVQFRDPIFADVVLAVLADTGLPAGALCLEVTEGMLMHSTPELHETLERLHRHGVRLSLDDFGTGYSSLAYLERFPLDELKIDRSFIAGLGSGGRTPDVVRAILALAESLDHTVVAEGVETEEQLAFLAREHCQRVQGFLFSRPVDPVAFAAQLVPEAAAVATAS